MAIFYSFLGFFPENNLLFFLATWSIVGVEVLEPLPPAVAAAAVAAARRSSLFFPPDLNFPEIGVAPERAALFCLLLIFLTLGGVLRVMSRSESSTAMTGVRPSFF